MTERTRARLNLKFYMYGATIHLFSIASGAIAMEFESRVWQLLERIDNADTVPDFYSIESDIETLRLEIDEVLRLESILKQTDQQPLEE